MSTCSSIGVHDQNGVRSITLQRLDKANALNTPMLKALSEAIESAQPDGNHAIVLRSASPRLFCAGGDIQEFCKGTEHLETQGEALRTLMVTMVSCPVPILAIARGKAAGAGVILLSLTDIVIGSQDLELSCPELAFNMYPFSVHVALETKITSAKARQLCLSCLPLGADQAQDLGLVTNVLPLDGFEDNAEKTLALYLSRQDALSSARKGRLIMEPPSHFIKAVETIQPLMYENFNKTGVQETIQNYLESLKTRAQATA